MPKLPRRTKTVKQEIPLPDALGGSTELALPVPRGLAAPARQIGEELAVAALLGGNLFGRTAMHPSLAAISDKAERGKVLNGAWRRYGTVNSLALATLAATWLPTRRAELGALWVSRTEKTLVLAKDATLGAVALTGVASAISGMTFAHEAPEGGVPMEDGEVPAPEAPSRAAKLKAVVNLAGSLNLAAEVALVVVNVGLRQRRTRRLLPR